MKQYMYIETLIFIYSIYIEIAESAIGMNIAFSIAKGFKIKLMAIGDS